MDCGDAVDLHCSSEVEVGMEEVVELTVARKNKLTSLHIHCNSNIRVYKNYCLSSSTDNLLCSSGLAEGFQCGNNGCRSTAIIARL